MEHQTIRGGKGPLVVHGLLADWERESRARLAVAEEEAELDQTQAEAAHLESEVSRLRSENQQLLTSLKTAQKILLQVRDSRGYQLFRLVGRWDAIEQGINARLAVAEEEQEVAQIRSETARLQGEVARLLSENQHLLSENQHLLSENQHLLGLLKTTKKILNGLRDSRGYRLFRLMGRWGSLEKGIDRLALAWPAPREDTPRYPRIKMPLKIRR